VDIRGLDLRIDPFTKQHETLNGRTQNGRFCDDWGNWFGCNNSNPLWHFPYPWDLLKRNPEVAIPRAYVDVPVNPGPAPVFPASSTLERFNDFDRANRFTSACGPAIYRDVLLGDAVYGNAFTCEPVHNLVNRQVLQARGATFTSDRHPDEAESEFFASTDPWSRPVSVRTGPDGALWIADMYRFVIEHPEWIPLEWQKKLDLRAGSDLGRIYRIVPDTGVLPKVPVLDDLDDAELVAQLESPNGTVRDLVHEMLLWRQAKGVVPLLREMAGSGIRPTARVHALCVLDGLGELDAATLRIALAGNHAGVVRHAIRLSHGIIPRAELAGLSDAILDDAHVACALAGVLGEGDPEVEPAIIADLISRHREDPYAIPVILSAVTPSNLEPVLRKLTEANPRGRSVTILPALARMAARWNDAGSLALLAGFTGNGDEPGDAWRFAVLSGLFEGGATLEKLTAGGATRTQLRTLVESVRARLVDSEIPEKDRAAAIRFLGNRAVFAGEIDLVLLLDQLTPQTPPALHEAVFEALGRARHEKTPQALSEKWKNLPPGDRAKALDLLLSRSEWIATLVSVIESGTIPRAEIDATTRNRLIKSKDESVRSQAIELFAGASNANRAEVLRSHVDVGGMKGEAVTGKAVFGVVCIVCHVADGVGNSVGPDLAALTDRSFDSLLVAILDPNRAVEDKFVNYTVATVGGASVVGIVADESANTVTIQQADGTARSLPRNEIVTMTSTGVSLMPEGFENILTKQQLADLVSYLATLGQASLP
jgi:putative heme-binding domain-containing protein